MIISYIHKVVRSNREFILEEIVAVKGLMHLLMKQRNTDEKWTKQEKAEIKRHLKNIARIIPALTLFLLPGGSILLPVLAESLDRRKARRAETSEKNP